MVFDKEYILENDRVLLSPLDEVNEKELAHFALEEPNLWDYSLLPANGTENYNKYIQYALDTRKSKSAYPFLVYDKKMKAYAGSTRFYDYQERHNTVQLGFTWYGEKFQGTGLNKNCKFLLLQFAFETLNLARVEFRADNNNERSIAAMKSIGCQFEGVLRNNCASSTGRRDSIVLSILESEWHDSAKQNLINKIGAKLQ
ncbi:MAG: RimJ/RimL family protein N-acetyltransferase [Patiriisocius sp.]|jgi:RimJ/RimL family protein N-acetyltransferase